MNLAEDDPEMIVARALRALRQEDGLPERQGEEDMEDAMGILKFLRKHGFVVQPVAELDPASRATPCDLSANETMRVALEEARNWHEEQDKALSKSGRGDASYYWGRHQHQEQRDLIDAALAELEARKNAP